MGTIDAFAGSGGWEQGARLLDLDLNILGIEIDEDACTAAISAGHERLHADIRIIDPADHPHVTGAILSSPCPTFGRSGLGTGRQDMQHLLDAITHAGSGCGCDWAEVEADLAVCADPRTALAAQCIRFALNCRRILKSDPLASRGFGTIRGRYSRSVDINLPALRWIALEQVPTVETMFDEIAAELMSYDDGTGEGGHGPGWESVDVFTLNAMDLGLPVRRERLFLVGRRYDGLGGRGVDYPGCPPEFLAPTMAEALGWPAGHQIRTRGN